MSAPESGQLYVVSTPIGNLADMTFRAVETLRTIEDEIRKAFPEDQQKAIATKNGWVEREEEQEYHVSCMAIGDGWVVGVMARYEIDKGYEYGAKICELVGQELRKAAGG